AAEDSPPARAQQAAFFGVQNDDDRATEISALQLVDPLADELKKRLPSLKLQTVMPSSATKARLSRLLGGDETPALLFTASHGMGFPKDDPRQGPDQGALLCQDWPGPREWDRPIPPEHYFAAGDVASDAGLLGLIAMHFAC